MGSGSEMFLNSFSLKTRDSKTQKILKKVFPYLFFDLPEPWVSPIFTKTCRDLEHYQKCV